MNHSSKQGARSELQRKKGCYWWQSFFFKAIPGTGKQHRHQFSCKPPPLSSFSDSMLYSYPGGLSLLVKCAPSPPYHHGGAETAGLTQCHHMNTTARGRTKGTTPSYAKINRRVVIFSLGAICGNAELICQEGAAPKKRGQRGTHFLCYVVLFSLLL